MKPKNKQPKTLKDYKNWRNLHYGLKAAPVATVAAPLGIEVGLNWNDWFKVEDKLSVGLGLILAVITTILSVIAITKKDSELIKKAGPFISLGIAFLLWGAVCWLLYSLLYQLAYLLLTAGTSILVAAIEDSVDKWLVVEKYETMKKLADEKGFTKKGKWQKQVELQAELDSREYEDDTRYYPHD